MCLEQKTKYKFGKKSYLCFFKSSIAGIIMVEKEKLDCIGMCDMILSVGSREEPWPLPGLWTCKLPPAWPREWKGLLH